MLTKLDISTKGSAGYPLSRVGHPEIGYRDRSMTVHGVVLSVIVLFMLFLPVSVLLFTFYVSFNNPKFS